MSVLRTASSETTGAGGNRSRDHAKLRVLPGEWSLRSLGSIASISAGGTPSRANPAYWNGEVPWITTTQVHFNVITAAEQFISQKGLEYSAAKLLNPGTLLVALYGQGPTRGRVAILGIEATTNQACAAIELHSEAIPQYLFYYLQASYEKIRSLSNKGNQANLNSGLIKSFPIALPPPEEQRAIAAALSDVDELIGALDKLTAKKRAIKLATMQQLLTGKTRLPGFENSKDWQKSEIGAYPADWSIRSLGSEIAGLDAGVSVRSVDSENSAAFRGGAVLKTSAVEEGRFLAYENKPIDPRDHNRAKLNPKAGTILISRMNTIVLVGECGYVDRDYPHLFVPDRLWMTRFHSGSRVSSRWLSYVLTSRDYREKLRAIATGTSGSMKNIAKASLLGLLFAFPVPEEQEAIAKVLADMDAEIAALEQRRDKTKAIKQGMMQSLLTGRVRLVKPEGTP